MNFLGTHDTPRILTVLGADNVPDNKADRAAYRLSPAQRQIGLERLRLAALILFTFPGAPTVYYGDEAAMEGWEDPFNRAGYPWAQEDTDLKAHFAELARFPALLPGIASWRSSLDLDLRSPVDLCTGAGWSASDHRGQCR